MIVETIYIIIKKITLRRKEVCQLYPELGFRKARSVRRDMAPMMVKMPLTLRSIVPAIPKEPGERAHLEEDLNRIGCIGLLSKP